MTFGRDLVKPAYKDQYARISTSPYRQSRRMTAPAVHIKKKKTVKKVSLFNRLISFGLLLSIGLLILPNTYNHTLRPRYRSFISDKTGATVDYTDFYNKSANIIYNSSVNIVFF